MTRFGFDREYLAQIIHENDKEAGKPYLEVDAERLDKWERQFLEASADILASTDVELVQTPFIHSVRGALERITAVADRFDAEKLIGDAALNILTYKHWLDDAPAAGSEPPWELATLEAVELVLGQDKVREIAAAVCDGYTNRDGEIDHFWSYDDVIISDEVISEWVDEIPRGRGGIDALAAIRGMYNSHSAALEPGAPAELVHDELTTALRNSLLDAAWESVTNARWDTEDYYYKEMGGDLWGKLEAELPKGYALAPFDGAIEQEMREAFFWDMAPVNMNVDDGLRREVCVDVFLSRGQETRNYDNDVTWRLLALRGPDGHTFAPGEDLEYSMNSAISWYAEQLGEDPLAPYKDPSSTLYGAVGDARSGNLVALARMSLSEYIDVLAASASGAGVTFATSREGWGMAIYDRGIGAGTLDVPTPAGKLFIPSDLIWDAAIEPERGSSLITSGHGYCIQDAFGTDDSPWRFSSIAKGDTRIPAPEAATLDAALDRVHEARRADGQRLGSEPPRTGEER